MIARTHAAALINSETRQAALTHAAQIRGRMLAEVAELLGATTYGTATDRRRQLVDVAIGHVLDSAAIRYYDDPQARTEYVAAYRAEWLAKI